MSRLRPFVVSAFAAWTFFSWIGRFRNVWADGTLSSSEKVANSVPVLIFTVVGAAVAVVVLRTPGGVLDRTGRRVVQAAAWWTIGYWVVRLPMILTDSHDVPFKAVHTVLAVIAWALAAGSLRAVRSRSSQERPPQPVAA
jgi:hypothetical protein